MSEREEHSSEKLEVERGEELPDRQVVSPITAGGAAPMTAAVALNAFSAGSTAAAKAEQNAEVDQST